MRRRHSTAGGRSPARQPRLRGSRPDIGHEKARASHPSESTSSVSPFRLWSGSESAVATAVASTEPAAVESATEPAAVESATEPSPAGAASEATTVEPAEAGRATHGLAPGRASTIESAEGTRATSGCAVWGRECVLLRATKSTPAVRPTGAMKPARTMESVRTVRPAPVTEARTLAIERPAIDERPAVRDERVVVVHDGVATPVESPVAPSPAEPCEEPDAEAGAEHDSRPGNEQPRIPVPSRPGDERRAIHHPGIVLRHVDDLRVGRFDDDLRSLLDYLLL